MHGLSTILAGSESYRAKMGRSKKAVEKRNPTPMEPSLLKNGKKYRKSAKLISSMKKRCEHVANHGYRTKY
jgi:hypothetical protein